MKALLICAMLGMFGAALVGCESDNGGSKHETVQDRKVTDANGNTVSESHTHSDRDDNR